MTFLDLFPITEIISSLGDEMVYVPGGGLPIVGPAIITYGVERVGNESYITEHINTVEFAKSLVADPKRGDLLTIRGESYSVESIDADDGLSIRVIVR